MATATFEGSTASSPASAAATAAARERMRDVRLDFFRGVGMFIILLAHTPANGWTNWIPARFGFSDATEVFVFCSGAASSLAFLKVFENKGFFLGSARVGFRIWQIYWCHIAVFFATFAALAGADAWFGTGVHHQNQLGLTGFLIAPQERLVGLFTLTYVPGLFDILPMYIVVLALMPAFIALGLIRPWLAIAASVALWAAVSQPWIAFLDDPYIFTGLNLPGDPIRPRTWFFNPFAWQLVFFTGFALGAGWIRTPPIDWRLMVGAAAILVVSIPLDPDGAPTARLLASSDAFEPLREARSWWISSTGPLTSKTFLGVLRYVHFLALAYLVWSLAGEAGRRIPRTGVAGALATMIRRVGQQSLAVFIASLVIARMMGVALHHTGWGDDRLFWQAVVNLIGFASLIAVAYIARWFRRQPWRS